MTTMQQPRQDRARRWGRRHGSGRGAAACAAAPRPNSQSAPRPSLPPPESALRVPLQPLQVGSHVGGVLIAQIAVFLQRLVDDVFQLRRQVGIQPNRGSGARFMMASKITPELSPRNGRRARRHLVQHDSKGEQVGPCVQFFGPHLLRRHIGHRTQRAAGTGQVLVR